MIKKVTKAYFVNTLNNEASIFVTSIFNHSLEEITEAIEKLSLGDFELSEKTIRYVTRRGSNFIQFKGGSRLYFDDHGTNEYYTINDTFYLKYNYYNDDFDGAMRTNIIVYGIVR